MAIGTTNTFTQNRNQIIDRAMAAIGIKTDHRALTAAEVSEASDELNIMMKSWKTKNYLWKTTEGTLFLATGQAKYRLDGSTANATEDFTETTTTADAAISATTFDVTSATGFVVGYNIGIVQDDSTILWTTISNISSLTITVDDALTAASSSGAKVYVYQTKINRPEEINSLRARTSDGNDNQTTALARDTYFNIPVKTTQSTPNQWYYDKQLSYGDIYLWPVPNSVAETVKFTYQKMFFDIDAAATDADFPAEWLDAIILNLALRLARIKGKDKEFREQLRRDAEDALDDVQGYDREDASIYFQPATSINLGSYR
tara:strand:- start:3921 stop:4871 length:951 start_codon:yes stop_codon:yes gene_type:complete